MRIDRHNCEEWFLLYADDELDATGRRMVEEFLAIHPDKAVLLEGFLNARFKPDDNLLFDGKQSLRKKGEDAHSEAEWERLLLMADGESTAEERVLFEKELTGDLLRKSQWESLSRTRLKPDLSITHPDRASLYRKGSAFPVIRWFAVSAAASLLLLLGWRLLPSVGGGSEKPDPIEARAKIPIRDLPDAVETFPPSVQTATTNPSGITAEARPKGGNTKPMTTTDPSAPADIEWSQTVAGAMDSKTENETVSQSETERVAASESLAVNGEKKPETVENTLAGTNNVSEASSFSSMKNVKTDFATEALIEEASEPAAHAIRRTILSRSRLKEAARKADRYYQKITNPTIEPRPMEVSWTSNRN
jgi:hypothetical protein